MSAELNRRGFGAAKVPDGKRASFRRALALREFEYIKPCAWSRYKIHHFFKIGKISFFLHI